MGDFSVAVGSGLFSDVSAVEQALTIRTEAIAIVAIRCLIFMYSPLTHFPRI